MSLHGHTMPTQGKFTEQISSHQGLAGEWGPAANRFQEIWASGGGGVARNVSKLHYGTTTTLW